MGTPTVRSGAERRTAPRVHLDGTLVGTARAHGAASRASIRLLNISARGCLVYAGRHALRPGETHVLGFHIDHTDEDLTLDARVVHASGVCADHATVCVAGLEFLGDSFAQKRAISRLLAACSRGRKG